MFKSAFGPRATRLVKVLAVTTGVSVALMNHRRSTSKTSSPSSSSSAPAGFSYGLGLGTAYYYFLGAVVQLLPPEAAQRLGIKVASYSKNTRRLLGFVSSPEDPSVLHTEVFGINFDNPVGLAAGFDQNGEAVDGFMDMGFGHVEIGSVTPNPQPGNPKPRIFRLFKDLAIINRYGFYSDGVDVVGSRLQQRLANDQRNQRSVLGVNLSKSGDHVDVADDYKLGLNRLAKYADYVVINLYSSNTRGIRDVQAQARLHTLLSNVKAERDRVFNSDNANTKVPPLLVKITPDLTVEDEHDLAKVCLEVGIDGLIVSNTTAMRDQSLKSVHKTEIGGLSGKPLAERSTALIGRMYSLTQGKLPIIGVGGIFTGEDAYRKIRQGASLVQLYTSFVYRGPVLVDHVKKNLATLLQRDGFKSVHDAVGVDVQLPGSAQNQ